MTYNSLGQVVAGLIRERRNKILLQLEGRSSEEDPPTSFDDAINEWISIVNARANKESLRDVAKGTKELETEASIVWRTA